MTRDIRFALRALLRSPAFTAVAVLMLAVGIGLSIFMFGSLNAMVLKPLPFAQADRLVAFSYTDSRNTQRNLALPTVDWLDLRERQKTLASLEAYWVGTANIGGLAGPAERLSGAWLSVDALGTLGVRPAMGREFAAADAAAGAEPVALIAYRTWELQFNSDPAVIGRSLRVNGVPTRIVGVMPRDFAFPSAERIWMPIVTDRAAAATSYTRLQTFGRLAEGVSAAQARADFDTAMTALAAERGEPLRGDKARMRSFSEQFVPGQIVEATKTMFIAVLLVLLIACANVASLVIARFAARTRELAVRAALGASRGRLIVQVLTETFAIALAATALGYAGADFASWFMRDMMDASPSGTQLPYWIDYRVDPRDLIFTAGIALVATVLAGLAPALRAGRVDVQTCLRQGGAGSIGGRGRLGRWLVAGEVALCVILLVCAGVSIRSALDAQRTPLGIETANVLTGRIAMFDADYPDEAARLRMTDALQPRLAELPGVDAVGFGTSLPLMGYGRERYERPGDAYAEDNQRPQIWASSVTAGYFDAFGIALREGRLFDARDGADAPDVAIVSASLAATAFPDRSAIGERLRVDPKSPESPWLTIVGVVADSVQADYIETSVTPAGSRSDGNLFRPLAQAPSNIVSFALRTDGDPQALAEAVRAAVTSVDANLPVYWLRPMEAWRAGLMWGPDILANLFGAFALFALLLTAAGVYAVLAFETTQRTREIGVRRALGAPAGTIVAMTLRRGGRQVLVGLLIGVPLALAFAQLLGGVMMPGAQTDPGVYVAVVLVLALVLVLAAVLPTRRALRVDPLVALRDE